MNRRSAASRLLPLLLLVLASVAARPASATSVTVPDNFATLQGAIDGSAADTIIVKAGEYPEDVVLHRRVCLLAYQSSAAFTPFFDLPVVRSLHLYSNDGGSTVSQVWIRGLRFRGAVTFINNASGTPRVVFEMCRMDSGFTAMPNAGNTFATFQMRGCLVFGGGFVNFYYPDIVQNAFVGGGLNVSGNGDVLIQGNYIQGPGDVGLTVCCSEGLPVASDNVITGFRVGIHGTDGGQYLGNIVTDCAENGIEATARFGGGMTFSGNVLRRCGSNGIRSYGTNVWCSMNGNTVDSVGGVGLLGEGSLSLVRNNTVHTTGSHGIKIVDGLVSGNTVLQANGDGIRSGPANADTNVVGRCAGAGIRSSASEIRRNTVYLNASSGIVLSSVSGAQVQLNLSYGNLGYGLDASGATAPAPGCNDWYANGSGATLGVSPGATDLAVDPRFCNVSADDVTLASTSPLLAAPGCGLIGARGQGCTSTVSVEAPAPSRQGLTAGPVPASGSIRFRWGGEATASTLEVFDVLGARRFHADLPRGVSEFVWNAADDAGLTLPAGVYFVRRVAGGRSEATRVVIQR